MPRNINFTDDVELNFYSHSWPMIQAAIVAGCYPGIGFLTQFDRFKKIRLRYFSRLFLMLFSNDMASLHPSSVIKRQIISMDKRSNVIKKYSDGSDPNMEFLVFQELSRLDSGLTVFF